MVTSEEIQKQLDAGRTVYSAALGRIGRVLRVYDGIVLLKMIRGRGVTRFDSGDPVELVVEGDKAFIRHPEWALKFD